MTPASSRPERAAWRSYFRQFRASASVNHAFWITAVFAGLQVVRLGSNIVLAHLLAPAIFGVMALINALRTGVELLTDVGVGQNIVVNPRGEEPGFVNTAWTVQVLRGSVLTLVGAAAAWPLAWLYGNPTLFPTLLVCASIFFLTGIHTPARFLMQRRRQVRNLSLLDAFNQISGVVISIGFAALMPTVWGMTLALIVSSALCSAATYALMNVRTLRLRIERDHLTAILHFGKWIFASSLVYFAASNFDRLYLPVRIPLALFGVYGIARSMSDLVTLFTQRIGGNIVFPAVARERETMQGRMSRVIKLRSASLGVISIAIGGGIAISDLFVTLAYDPRYAAAAVILPMLLVGTWFSVQAAISESVLLGLARPSSAALANLLKLAFTATFVVVALAFHNFFLAFAALALGDIPRYFLLLHAQHRTQLRFWVHDVLLFGVMAGSAVVVRLAMRAVGLADGFVSALQWTHIHALWAGIVG